MEKTQNNRAWFLVLPVLVIVAFSAVIPLMTVVNYSVQDTFGNNQFFWAGTEWFTDVLDSGRFWDALTRNLIFSGNTFNGVTQATVNPLLVEHSQATAATT